MLATLNQSLSIEYPQTGLNPQVESMVRADDYGAAVLDNWNRAWNNAAEWGWGEHPSLWPDEVQEAFRQDFRTLVARQAISVQDYMAGYGRYLGELNWQFEPPPPLADLPADSTVLHVGPDDVFAIDGDTVDVIFGDGSSSRFRLIGLNAPDAPMPGAEEAYADLASLLHNEGYEDISLVFWRSDYFGLRAGTDFSTGGTRWKAWLYVNGRPIYNPDVFTYRNPLGISTGVEFVPLARPGGS